MYSSKAEELRYKITPKFNLLYELFMPTGRKIKSTFFFFILILLVSIYFLCGASGIKVENLRIFENINILTCLKYISIILTFILALKLIFHIVMQIFQYKHITYKFYDTYMVYEDDFLNQHKKNIEYSNIKEIEIRRTIIDRILGFGVIVVYTNAENSRSNGLVIYGLKNPKKTYDIIDSIIHKDENS